MIIQIEGTLALAIVAACTAACYTIIQLCLGPIKKNQERQEKILERVKGDDDLKNIIDIRADYRIKQHEQEREHRPRNGAPKPSSGHVLGVIIFFALIAYLFSGCAHYKIDPETGEGTSYGFLRNLSVARETSIITYPDGTRTETTKEVISTTSTTGDVLLGANELIGTAVDAAEKVKP